MQPLRKIVKYVFYMLLILAVLVALDLGAVLLIHFSAGSVSRTGLSLSSIAQELSFDGENAELSPAGQQLIDEVNGFGLLLDADGETVWRYRAPEDIPDRFSLCDVASFSRWYLHDYPVYSWIVPNGGSEYLLVLGLPQNSIWRYNLLYDLPILLSYRKYFPLILLVNLLILLLTPFFLTRRSNKKQERERTEWIAGVSHDIRTPLALAVLHTEKIIDRCPDPADAARQALEQEIRLKSLIDNLNTDNRLRYGYGKQLREKIHLPSVIRETVCAFADTNEDYDFACDIAQAAENCTIRTDRELLRRLLENLISNSIRHNPGGCRITIRLRPEKAGGRRYLLTVRDNGAGVSPQKLQELNSTRKTSKNSVVHEHGLGLAVVRRIAQAYRWQLRYVSTENEYFECRLLLRK